jgi:hypothetical protein
MSVYRVYDTAGEDLGLLEHPAPNLEPGGVVVVVVADAREAIVTACVEPGPGRWSPCSRWPSRRRRSRATSRSPSPNLPSYLRIEERKLAT